jgi:hypothetical protein
LALTARSAAAAVDVEGAAAEHAAGVARRAAEADPRSAEVVERGAGPVEALADWVAADLAAACRRAAGVAAPVALVGWAPVGPAASAAAGPQVRAASRTRLPREVRLRAAAPAAEQRAYVEARVEQLERERSAALARRPARSAVEPLAEQPAARRAPLAVAERQRRRD